MFSFWFVYVSVYFIMVSWFVKVLELASMLDGMGNTNMFSMDWNEVETVFRNLVFLEI